MTERDLKKMSRSDLLEMLIEQGKELEEVKQQLEKAQAELADRRIVLDNAGSIAEASLAVNGVFLAAQAAADEYLTNIKELNQRQDEIIAAREKISVEKAERMQNDTAARCSRLEEETKSRCSALENETAQKCARMEEESRVRSEAWWSNVQERLRTLYESQSELKTLMTNFGIPKNVVNEGEKEEALSDDAQQDR